MTWDSGYGLLEAAACLKGLIKDAPSASASASAGSQEEDAQPSKTRFIWRAELEERFVQAVQELGGPGQAIPSKILSIMKVPNLQREHVASHLQASNLMVGMVHL
eukprot:gene3034-3315_t